MSKVQTTRGQFSEQIKTAWQKTIAGIFECGRLLIAAKEGLPHGEFTKMVEQDLPFGERTAERLMAIAGDKRLSNPTHVSVLPASWGTLYELTRLEDDEFDAAVADGRIRPDMTREDVVRIVHHLPPAPQASYRVDDIKRTATASVRNPEPKTITVEVVPSPVADRPRTMTLTPLVYEKVQDKTKEELLDLAEKERAKAFAPIMANINAIYMLGAVCSPPPTLSLQTAQSYRGIVRKAIEYLERLDKKLKDLSGEDAEIQSTKH